MDEITLKSEVDSLAQYGGTLIVIRDHDEYMIANEYLTLNKAKQDSISDYFDPEIESANKTHKGLCAKKKVLLDPLKDNRKKVEEACSNYLLEQERIRAAEQKRLDDEAKVAAEAAQKAIIAEAEKEEKAGDIQCASDLMEQAADIVPVKMEAPKVISNTQLASGTTSWKPTLEITINDPVAVYEAVKRGEFPITCVEITVKIGVLKKHFEGKGIKEYNTNGVTVKEKKQLRVGTY